MALRAAKCCRLFLSPADTFSASLLPRQRQSLKFSNYCSHFIQYQTPNRCRYVAVRNQSTNHLTKHVSSYPNTVHEADDSNSFGTLRSPLEKFKKERKNESFLSSVEKDWKLEERRILQRARVSKKNHTFGYRERRIADPSDKFGDQAADSPMWFSETLDNEQPEPGDDSTITFPYEKVYKSAQAYMNQMIKLVKEKKLKEALELFPHMQHNHIMPIHGNYTFMIGACGKAGYTDMAFKLLRQMTDRGFRPTPATLTGLFNSCAESPFADYGLNRAQFLKEKIGSKNWQLTQTTYHAMIKAFGRCGDIQTAFEIVDEMAAAEIKVTEVTYSFLLMACISDKEAGFTHAIEVWRKMVSKKLQPNCFTFNLLLRAARDCGIGSEEIASLLLQHWSSYTKRPYGLNRREKLSLEDFPKLPNPEFPAISSTPALTENSRETLKSKFEMNSGDLGTPSGAEGQQMSSREAALIENAPLLLNLLSTRPVYGPQITDLMTITKNYERLALLGNAEGFLATMQRHKAQPDRKTLTLILENLAPNRESEDQLLSLMEEYKVIPDTDFFNILIKRRNMRNDYDSATKVLRLIHKHNLSPDVVTFGVLALGCHNRKLGVQLLREMKGLGFCPNVEILGTLVTKATWANDFYYMKIVLSTMKELGVKPNERFIADVEDTVENTRKRIIEKERGKEVPDRFHSKLFMEQFRAFCDFYFEWLNHVHMETEPHPWQQYKTTAEDETNQVEAH